MRDFRSGLDERTALKKRISNTESFDCDLQRQETPSTATKRAKAKNYEHSESVHRSYYQLFEPHRRKQYDLRSIGMQEKKNSRDEFKFSVTANAVNWNNPGMVKIIELIEDWE